MKRISEKPLSAYISRLKEDGLLISSPDIDLSQPVKKLSFDSRETVPGTLFICKGLGFKTEYARAAMERSAICLLCEGKAIEDLPCAVVSDVRKAMALCSWIYCCEGYRSFPLIGLTGTKGKST
ncbi:MAG: UDP-N-acetylmuramyl peptide synthase, partial [Firmicutes bacterium]|nr:UDP-N-acetylmuramyl peptide synthase [Bacillota bacterium]